MAAAASPMHRIAEGLRRPERDRTPEAGCRAQARTRPPASRTPSVRSRRACSRSCPGTSRPVDATTLHQGTPSDRASQPDRIRGENSRGNGVGGRRRAAVVEAKHPRVDHPIPTRFRAAHLPEPPGPFAVQIQGHGRDPEHGHGAGAHDPQRSAAPGRVQAPGDPARQESQREQHGRVEQEAVEGDHGASRIRRAARVANAMIVTWGFTASEVGNTLASGTTRPSIPRTRPKPSTTPPGSRPIRAVPMGW